MAVNRLPIESCISNQEVEIIENNQRFQWQKIDNDILQKRNRNRTIQLVDTVELGA
jgi:hypothetical protein